MTREFFENILERTREVLENEATSTPFSESKKFETRVREVISDVLTEEGVPIEIDFNPNPQAFPDIAVGEFGVEVKFTSSDTWKSIANSILESKRDPDVKHVYVMFGKMGGTPGVRWSAYEDSVVHVRTSHVPRFEIDLDPENGTEPLFRKIGIPYDTFRKLPMTEKMIHIREYARKIHPDDDLWWACEEIHQKEESYAERKIGPGRASNNPVHYPAHTRGTKLEFDFTNETIEKLILKRMLSDKKILGTISGFFDQRIFESRPLGVMARLAVAYFKRYDSVPTNKIMAALGKKYCESRGDAKESDLASFLLDVHSLGIDVGSQVAKENCQMYLKKKLAYLTICDTANDVIKTGDVSGCFDRLEKTMKISFEDKDLGMSYFSDDDMKEHWDYITNPDAKLKTGWTGLDNVTNGGFLKDGKMIACFMGQAGLGKSLFLSNITVNFLRNNLGVVVISLEMSENVYSQRFDAHISKLNINRLKDNSSEAISRIKEFHREHPGSSLIVKEYPPRSVKCSEIENYLDNLKASGAKIDVIVIDYLNLILPNNKTDSMYSGIMEVVERLRTISYKFAAPVITATQANRQGMNNENINMEHVSESGGIAHTVDFMGGLYQMDEDREHGIINMRVIKNRFGGSGKIIPFHMNPENLVLEDTTGRMIGDETPSEADQILNNLHSISADMNDAL